MNIAERVDMQYPNNAKGQNVEFKENSWLENETDVKVRYDDILVNYGLVYIQQQLIVLVTTRGTLKKQEDFSGFRWNVGRHSETSGDLHYPR